MGIDINTYRSRVGRFALCCNVRIHQHKYERYRSHTVGTDIHFRSLVVNVFLVAMVIMCYGVVRSRVYFENTYALKHYNECNWVIPSPTGNTLYGCNEYGGHYRSYLSRLIALSGDVELNPGPGSDLSNENTEKILHAIQGNRDDINNVKDHIKGVRDEVLNVKSEMVSICTAVGKIESIQTQMKDRIDKLDEKLSSTQYQHEVLVGDFAAISIQHEQQEERIANIEHQLNRIESGRLKSSMRIFGLAEAESNDNGLISLVKEKVLNVAEGEEAFGDDALVSARRVGVQNRHSNDQERNPARMVIVEFSRSADKFKLFNYRDKLRESGIRLANDLTYTQRKQLKDAKMKGLNGYFKNGKLHTYVRSRNNMDGTGSRVFRRAARPTEMLQGVSGENSEGAMEVNQEVDYNNISNMPGASSGVD